MIVLYVINADSKPIFSLELRHPLLLDVCRRMPLTRDESRSRSGDAQKPLLGSGKPLNRKLGVSSSKAYPIGDHSNIRSHDRQASRKASNRPQEISKQDHYAVCFHDEPNKGPLHEDKDQA
jgi:hypothetical protein